MNKIFGAVVLMGLIMGCGVFGAYYVGLSNGQNIGFGKGFLSGQQRVTGAGASSAWFQGNASGYNQGYQDALKAHNLTG